ncbi:MAG: dipeptide epimerase [Alphaproteobacteria bacterium]|nr:dipeptide epimerase [Alphaproteobacteria bacterium]
MTSMPLGAYIETFPVAGRFTIARGSRTDVRVVRVAIEREGVVGMGECVPYARYGETVDGTVTEIMALGPRIAAGMGRAELQQAMPPGAARNGIDCALWDLEARLSGVTVATMAGVAWPMTMTTAFTISLGTPEAMAEAAAKAAHMPLLKLKLGGRGDAARLLAIRAAVPKARLVVDANEGWGRDELPGLLEACAQVGVELVEQPLPAGEDAVLGQIEHLVPICADESAHALAGLDALPGRYDAVNIKLDKTGGLTEALAVARRAEELGLSIMVGCMLSTSLSMLPASVLADFARWIDLDGPLLLAQDRPGGPVYRDGVLDREEATLWGG